MSHKSTIDKKPLEPTVKGPQSVLGRIACWVVVIVSATIAFFATCYPAGLIGIELAEAPIGDAAPNQSGELSQVLFFAIGIGGCSALFVGSTVYRAIRKHWRNQ